jgi:hypothetical protein
MAVVDIALQAWILIVKFQILKMTHGLNFHLDRSGAWLRMLALDLNHDV